MKKINVFISGSLLVLLLSGLFIISGIDSNMEHKTIGVDNKLFMEKNQITINGEEYYFDSEDSTISFYYTKLLELLRESSSSSEAENNVEVASNTSELEYVDEINDYRCKDGKKYYITVCQTQSNASSMCKYTSLDGEEVEGETLRKTLRFACEQPKEVSKGQEVVNYASQFVGKRYLWGGAWNGELPYKATDCSGLVQGVYKHFGYSLPRTTALMWANRSKLQAVDSSDIQAGDIVLYPGHVAILTGNGNEIIHAKGRKYGIVVDKDYKKACSRGVRGIFRVIK